MRCPRFCGLPHISALPLRLARLAVALLVVVALIAADDDDDEDEQVKPQLSGVPYAGMNAQQLVALKGQPLLVYLRSGKQLKDMEVVDARPGTAPDTLKDLVFKSADGKGKPRKLAASALERIVVAGKPYLIVGGGKKYPWRLVDLERREKKVDAYLLNKGMRLWAKLTESQQQARTDKLKELFTKVQADHPERKFHLHETAYFLFYTDMPDKEIEPLVADLDKMYVMLGQAFGLQRGQNIWAGKAAVVAFSDVKTLADFEKKNYGKDHRGDLAVIHLEPSGEVLMSCRRTGDPNGLATMMIPLTAHGYMFRYRSTVQLPSWISGGIADWVQAAIVPGDQATAKRQKEGADFVKSYGKLGTFFESEEATPWQIGVASTMVDILLKRDATRYHRFIEGIKEGQTWQDSLLTAFELTPDDLAHLYGERIGLPDLGQ